MFTVKRSCDNQPTSLAKYKFFIQFKLYPLKFKSDLIVLNKLIWCLPLRDLAWQPSQAFTIKLKQLDYFQAISIHDPTWTTSEVQYIQ
jgi:hypothetical protein